MRRKCLPNSSAWSSHMCRSVPSEFDSISGGASSRPETSTLIGQSSSTVMIGMTFLPFEFLLLAPATGLQPPIRRRQGVLQRAFQDGRKALSAGVRVLRLTEGDGTDGD